MPISLVRHERPSSEDILISSLEYRSEIDGLRAFAVVAVILFHAGFEIFSGGFIGVDIFFVISGFLITSLLMIEIEAGQFRLADFYERRARRILPALFFVVLCCIIFAVSWMLPVQLKNFWQSVVSIVVFSSNILFWLEDGYFAATSELKPLLHTWSLAVEEQYYILFPITLAGLWKLGKRRVFWIFLIMAMISLLLAEWGWRHKPSANFYLAPTRAWELLAGSLCAFMTVGRPRQTSNAASLIGLGLILITLFVFDETTPFPSLYALLPVVGTALIVLYAGPDTWVQRVLSWPPVVGIGLISYSAYLWHQPLFAFARLRSPVEPTKAMMSLLILVCFALAWATWRWIEQPFRNKHPMWCSTRFFVMMSGAVAIFLIGMGIAGHLGKLPLRALSTVESQMMATATPSPMRERCHFDREDDYPASASCIYFGTDPTLAVYGDSHGAELAYGLAKAMQPLGHALMQFTVSNCKPSFGVQTGDYCSWFYEDRLAYLLDHPEIETVVLAFRTDHGDSAVSESMVNLANHLNAAGRRVVLVLQAPTLPRDLSAYIRYGDRENALEAKARLRRDWRTISAHVYDALPMLDTRVTVFDLADVFCDAQQCYAIRDGGAMYIDDNHLSIYAAQRAAPAILAVLE